MSIPGMYIGWISCTTSFGTSQKNAIRRTKNTIAIPAKKQTALRSAVNFDLRVVTTAQLKQDQVKTLNIMIDMGIAEGRACNGMRPGSMNSVPIKGFNTSPP
mmetsp:Transcript_8935/g.17480  ORF Transcript_8935/g.17480 Transcript_8935/m.17480 type:complete len:102 (-) Transcript_8935:13-318(-)